MKSNVVHERVVIITGAGQGIGRAFALAFAREGAVVVIAERNLEGARQVASEISAGGGQALAIATDVADEASVQAMAQQVEQTYGRIDVLVNNAAIFSTLDMRSFEQIPLQEWESVLRVNVTGPFLCARAVLPAMRRQGSGRIINIGSAAVAMGRPNYLHYIASKGAVAAMTGSMARELGGDGITVNSVLPGATFTEVERKTVSPEQKKTIVSMQCIPRTQAPDDLTGAVLFLASEGAAFITGQGITIDGGATHR